MLSDKGRRRAFLSARFVTLAGGAVWVYICPLVVYLATGELKTVFVLQMLIYLMTAVGQFLFPLILHKPVGNLVVGAILTQVLAASVGAFATFQLLAPGENGDNLWLAVFSISSALGGVASRFSSIIAESPILFSAFSHADERRRIVRTLPASQTSTTAMVYFLAALCLALPAGSRDLASALRTSHQVARFVIVGLFGFNLLTFAAEWVLLSLVLPTGDSARSEESMAPATIPSGGWLPEANLCWLIAVSTCTWLTVLYPGPVLFSCLEETSSGTVPLTSVLALGGVGSMFSYFGNLWASHLSDRKKSLPFPPLFLQSAALIFACVAFAYDGYTLFMALVVVSRFFLGAFYVNYRDFLLELATSKASHARAVTLDSQIAYIVHSLFLGGVFLFMSRFPKDSTNVAFLIVASCSAACILFGAFAWQATKHRFRRQTA